MVEYKFTQPIRYYKANDPYYYEVDNIPLRQLEENILFVKGELDKPPGGRVLTDKSELDLRQIKQLRPRVKGTNSRTIEVNAGWFNARVNDAFKVSKPLMELVNKKRTVRGGSRSGPFDYGTRMLNWIPDMEGNWTGPKQLEVWNAFVHQRDEEYAYNMNGLEVTYTFYSTPGQLGNYWATRAPLPNGWERSRYGNYPQANQHAWYPLDWPLQAPNLLSYVLHGSPPYGGNYAGWTPDPMNYAKSNWGNVRGGPIMDYWFSNLPKIHLDFVRMWRSPFRTAIVDFPKQTIEIPAFDKWDFWYREKDGKLDLTKTLEDAAVQRIDLLVAYAVPIDREKAYLSNYSEAYCDPQSSPKFKTIFRPELGIVRGAGVGLINTLTRNKGAGPGHHHPGFIRGQNIGTDSGCYEKGLVPDVGGPKILANLNDSKANASLGLTNRRGVVVNGSFPSPDDLVNIAPILAQSDTDNSMFAEERMGRIGQTALPLAYIVVKKGSDSLTDDDILDIRPFMRTAELTYNERAGVAAANPPLSLANPAVGLMQLQTQFDVISGEFARKNPIEGAGAGNNTGTIIYSDYVQGGLVFGVEGTLLSMCDGPQGESDPFGKQTQQKTSYKASNDTSYDFAWATSSKNYLDYKSGSTGWVNKRALLEYFFKERQPDLKRWLRDPGSPGVNAGPYLNFPSERSVSLLPEWDPPIDDGNATAMFGPTAGDALAADPTMWMWMEGTNDARNYAFFPGGVEGPATKTPTSNWLEYGMKQGIQQSGNLSVSPGSNYLNYFAITNSKRFKIVLPEWCTDYDVLVDYSNCLPFTGIRNNLATAGLNIQKGPVSTSIGNKKEAVFVINSTTSPLPSTALGNAKGGAGNLAKGMLTEGGAILDKTGNNPGSKSNQDGFGERLWQWLSYTVVAPQFVSRFGTGYQSAVGARQDLNGDPSRLMPKLGAAFYPTVSFKIIGYSQNPMLNGLSNTNSTANKTGVQIPDNALYGSYDKSLTTDGWPVYPRAIIDLEGM